MEHEIWHKESDGHLSAEVPGLKLFVRKLDNCARYVIQRRADDDRSCAGDMLSSGTEPSVDLRWRLLGERRRGSASCSPSAAGRQSRWTTEGRGLWWRTLARRDEWPTDSIF